MPKARPVKEECCLKTRKEAWKTEWIKVVAAECRGRSSQDHHQLDGEEMAGRTSLLKRIAPIRWRGNGWENKPPQENS